MSRTEWILGLVLAALLIAVGYFAIAYWLGPSDLPVTVDGTVVAPTRAVEVGAVPTPAFVGDTALLAFGLAQQEIAGWEADAILLSAKATFPYGNALEDSREGRSNWTFTFYSPAAAQVKTVSVVAGTVSGVGERAVEEAFTPAGVGGWRLDSNEILALFLEQGGEEFLSQNNVSTLTMALTTDNESGRIEWLIALFGDQTNRSLTMTMDAGSGETLEIVRN